MNKDTNIIIRTDSDIKKEFLEIVYKNGHTASNVLNAFIVDIVETGKTLYENDLEPKADIVDISARLVSNKVSYKFKNKEIAEISARLEEILLAKNS